jgi:hypothetical protein
MTAERLDGAERHEHKEAVRAPEISAEHKKRPEHHNREQEKINPEQAARRAESEAKSAKDIKVETSHDSGFAQQHLVSSELRAETLRRNLKKVRRELSWPNKAFSKVIHQPVIDAVSKAGAHTIARPNGVLTGAIVALVGSSYVFYTAKHYGFEYNYWIVFILFGGGYILGLFIDLLIFVLKRPRRSGKF